MAHFARLDDNNIVTMVTVVSNDDMLDDTGAEVEALGAAVCESVVGPGPWVQTSYHGNFRNRYAGVGMAYSSEHDAFIAAQPYPSWVLDLDDPFDWVPPVPKPEEECENGERVWNEENLSWECRELVNDEVS